MYKNNILNLVLFIVVISLASVIYFSEEKDTELEKPEHPHHQQTEERSVAHNTAIGHRSK